jgi:dihydrodiol dehydrogenase / D-xylose 1-dehydrogenase (NADP)
VLGTKGRLKIHTPGHCPTKLSAVIKGAGRGNSEGELEYDFPLPADTDEIIVAGRYFYPNSAGFAYEAAAVARCIAAGKKEAPQYTWKETLLNARLINEMRSQLGVQPLTPPELRYHRDTSTGV